MRQRERAHTEAAALRALAGHEVPAPRLLWQGRLPYEGWVVVSSRVRGRPVARPDDSEWLQILATTLAAVHRVSPHGRGLATDPGPARAWLDSGPPPDLGPIAQTVWRELQERRFELGLDDPVLVHGDFHAGNVHWVGRRVAGVIDWEMARWGPAAADVAYAYMDLVLAAGRPAADRLSAYARIAGIAPGFDAWLLLAALRPLPDPARWLPSYEAAGWRGLTPILLRRRLAALVRSII